jgi:hypothetical protein
MQCFLPYPDFHKSAACLDRQRLGKQRLEALQLIRALEGYRQFHIEGYEHRKSGWANHPAAKMWVGYVKTLKCYYDAIVAEWEGRGYVNNLALYYPDLTFVHSMEDDRHVGMLTDDAGFPKDFVLFPAWFGDEKFHASHRSNLLRKDREHYAKFGWKESNTLPYIWPSPVHERPQP